MMLKPSVSPPPLTPPHTHTYTLAFYESPKKSEHVNPVGRPLPRVSNAPPFPLPSGGWGLREWPGRLPGALQPAHWPMHSFF